MGLIPGLEPPKKEETKKEEPKPKKKKTLVVNPEQEAKAKWDWSSEADRREWYAEILGQKPKMLPKKWFRKSWGSLNKDMKDKLIESMNETNISIKGV